MSCGLPRRAGSSATHSRSGTHLSEKFGKALVLGSIDADLCELILQDWAGLTRWERLRSLNERGLDETILCERGLR